MEIQDGRYSSGLYKKGFAPHMFGCPLYLHNTKKACFVRLRGCPYAPIHLDAPICLDGPHMFGHPHMFGCPPICLPVCLDTPICWIPLYVRVPPVFGCPLYAGTPSICLDAPHMFGWCLDTPCIYTTQRNHVLSD